MNSISNEIDKTFNAIVIIKNSNDEILLIKSNNNYSLPSGINEENENINECVQRVVGDETGYCFDENDFNFLNDLNSKINNIPNLLYTIEENKSLFKVNPETLFEGNNEIVWLSLKEAMELLSNNNIKNSNDLGLNLELIGILNSINNNEYKKVV